MTYIMMMERFFKKICAPLLLICTILSLCTACDKNITQLDTPKNLVINTQEILSWDKVKHATGYKVIVENSNGDIAEIDTKENYADLFSYFYNPYEFKVLVYAYDETNKYTNSNDSIIVTYQIKDNVSLYKVRAINNNTEYEIACSDNEKLSGKVLIPKVFNGLPVTKIAQYGFSNCKNITSVILQSSITEIGGGAFAYCDNLVRVSLPDSITQLGSAIFTDCISLTNVNIPNSVETIMNPFINCLKLEEIYIPASVTSIGSTAFLGCDNLKNITIDENNPIYKVDAGCIINMDDNSIVVGTNYSVIPDYVTKIVQDAFSRCRKIEKMIIPGNVKIVEVGAFGHCTNLKEIIFEEGVEYIRANGSGLDSIETVSIPYSVKQLVNFFPRATFVFPNGNARYTVDGNCLIDLEESKLLLALNKNATIPSYIKTIGADAFLRWEGECIDIPDGVETIGIEAFMESNIKCIRFPSTLKTIYDSAFENCKNLEDITFEEGVELIRGCAFRGCSKLTQVELPNSLKRIGGEAFNHCCCVILMHNTIEEAGMNCFTTCTLYCDIDPRDFTLVEWEPVRSIANDNTYATNCDISEGYVKSFQYFNYTIQDGYTIRPIHSFSGKIYSFIPYREGYKFLGWTTNPETNEAMIEPFYKDSIDYTIKELDGTQINVHVEKPNYCWYIVNMEKEWENGMIFYSVWEKIE